MPLEVGAPHRIGLPVLAQTIAVRRAPPYSPSLLDEPILTQNLSNRARRRQRHLRIVPLQDDTQLARSPTRVFLPGSQSFPLRRPRQREDATKVRESALPDLRPLPIRNVRPTCSQSFGSLQPFVQGTERLPSFKVPAMNLTRSFMQFVSSHGIGHLPGKGIVTHVAGLFCHQCTRSGPKFCLTAFWKRFRKKGRCVLAVRLYERQSSGGRLVFIVETLKEG